MNHFRCLRIAKKEHAYGVIQHAVSSFLFHYVLLFVRCYFIFFLQMQTAQYLATVTITKCVSKLSTSLLPQDNLELRLIQL